MRLLTAVLTALALAAPLPAQSRPAFVFNKNDLKVLAECDALESRFETRALILHDAPIDAYLSKLAAPLLPSQVPEHVAWNYRILRNSAAVAFALPNGSIYLSAGLLSRAENDDQLFGTLAHEIAHVTEHHPYLYLREIRTGAMSINLLYIGSSVLVGVYGYGPAILVDSVAGKPGEKNIIDAVLKYSRDYEEAADQKAVEQMKQAGRDPVHLARLALVLAENIDPQPVPMLHNNLRTLRHRVDYLERLSGADRDPGPELDAGYIDRMGAAILQTISLDLNTRQYRSAVASAERFASARPGDPVAEYWLGESYRALGPRDIHLTEQQSEPKAQRAALREDVRHPEAEEEALLAGSPEGKAALEANDDKAEEAFRGASQLDPSMPEPYFGLGLLYEREGQKEKAAEAYRKYISLCTREADRQRAKRRLEDLATNSGGGAK